MEQGDVPIAAQLLQEAQQGAGTFRELEAVQQLRLAAKGAAADHVPHMQLGGFVFRHVRHLIASAGQGIEQGAPVFPRIDLQADIHLGFLLPGVAVVEFRHRTLADGPAEAQKTARPLLDGHAEHRLPALA